MAAAVRTHFLRNLFQPKQLYFANFVRGSKYDSKYVGNAKTMEAVLVPLQEDDIRHYSKIKAALTDDHCFTDSDPTVQKLINMIMQSGKKSLAQGLVFKALEHVKRHQLEKYHSTTDKQIKDMIELDPFVVLRQALENGKPLMIIKKIRKSGQNLQAPIPCKERRQEFLSMKWLIEVANDKDQKAKFHLHLGREIINAFNFQGGLIKKKQDMHKLCEANKTNAHLGRDQ